MSASSLNYNWNIATEKVNTKTIEGIYSFRIFFKFFIRKKRVFLIYMLNILIP
jgi:hypothetical protein